MERYERIGARLMNRVSHGSAMQDDPIAAVLGDPGKRAAAAQILGQAYVAAQALIERHRLTRPAFDPMDESGWPRL